MASLLVARHRGSRKAEVGEAAERPRISHVEAYEIAESGNCTLDMVRLLLEPGENATRHRAASAMDKQIGIAQRCQAIVENQPLPSGILVSKK
jgi:hypothetical protein